MAHLDKVVGDIESGKAVLTEHELVEDQVESIIYKLFVNGTFFIKV